MSDSLDITPNVTLYDDAGNPVDIILDGSIYRLAVDADITGGNFQLQPFVPVIAFDSAGTALTTSWTTILNYSGEGKLDFIACALGTSNYKVRLTIDGNEVFDISMADLNTIGLTNAVNVNIWAETALKNFRYRPLISVDFTTSLKVELAMTTGTGTAYWLINYRTLP